MGLRLSGPGIAALNNAFVPHQATAPDPAASPVYVDQSVSPPQVKVWDGAAWGALSSGFDGGSF